MGRIPVDIELYRTRDRNGFSQSVKYIVLTIKRSLTYGETMNSFLGKRFVRN
jgi:hypothetical protein